MAKLLWRFGIRQVFIYRAGLQAWAAESRLPMDHLVNYQNLVFAEWIEAHISGEKLSNYPGMEISVFEVSWGGIEAYKAGHIPGAIHLDLSSIEIPPSWNICSDDELLDYLLAQGITCNSLVVLYGRDTMVAIRTAYILMYAGVRDVRLLDGGFDSWLKADYPVETGVRQPTPVESFGGSMPGCPEYMLDIEETKALLSSDQGLLVSVRSWEEYIGKTSGYDFIKAKGRIAGAVWGHSGSDPHHMQDFRNLDSTMRSFHEIESNWQDANITPNKNIAFYCGTGWRASEAFFYAYLMGWKNIAVFDGGWLEWSQDKLNPILLGVP
jgi:thiosulfate/3-mercaptopyruvate sulfurtransferase